MKILSELTPLSPSYNCLKEGFKQCSKCNGFGMQEGVDRIYPYMTYHELCTSCNGEGQVETNCRDIKKCDNCNGQGLIKELTIGVINCMKCNGTGYAYTKEL